MTSIHDVARATGVSTATVSRALRGLPNVSAQTREAVRRAARELGYVPSSSAAGLASGRHHAIAAIVPVIDRWFYAMVIEGAENLLRSRGYDLFLLSLGMRSGDRTQAFSMALLRKRADGVIALGIDFSKEERRELRSSSTPAAVVGGPVRGLLNVGVDEAKATALAMGHLLDLGHERIAHIGGLDDYNVHPSVGLLRRAGWEDALLARNIHPRSDWFVSGSFTLPDGRRAALELLGNPHDRPTAVFAGSDEMAFGVLLAAQELGIRVPEDLSVVGIDDHDYAESFGLTTVRQDPADQGRTAATMILDAIDGKRQRARSVKGACALVVRGSTAPPRSTGTALPRSDSILRAGAGALPAAAGSPSAAR